MDSLKRFVITSLFGLAAYSAASLAESLPDQLVNAAIERTRHQVTYDGSYRRIAYPVGDVPPNTGVCTDVIVRACRALGVDLQTEVHEDMVTAFQQIDYRQIAGQR